MLRALPCPSSGGQIVLSQHLVSSLSVNGFTVYRMSELTLSCIFYYTRLLRYSYTILFWCFYMGTPVLLVLHYISYIMFSLLSSGILYSRFTESDDTRCCDNTICPPEDRYVNARNMSKIVIYTIYTYCYRIKELCIKVGKWNKSDCIGQNKSWKVNNRLVWSDFDRASSLLCGNKMPTRCNRWYLLQILLHVQHVSGNTMPIISSSRVLYRWSLPVVFGAAKTEK